MALIETVALAKHYSLGDVGIDALQGITLSMEQGEFVKSLGYEPVDADG
jgi:hypothetical protein